MITVKIPGKSVSKGRPRFTKTGQTYTPAKTVNAEAFMKWLAKDEMKGRPLMVGPLVMQVLAVFVPPKSSKKRLAAMLSGAEMPAKKPDLDNLLKTVCDAFNGIVYHDDAQIVTISAAKVYGPEPVTIITVKSYYGGVNVK